MNIAQVLKTPLLWLGFLRPETLLNDHSINVGVNGPGFINQPLNIDHNYQQPQPSYPYINRPPLPYHHNQPADNSPINSFLPKIHITNQAKTFENELRNSINQNKVELTPHELDISNSITNTARGNFGSRTSTGNFLPDFSKGNFVPDSSGRSFIPDFSRENSVPAPVPDNSRGNFPQQPPNPNVNTTFFPVQNRSSGFSGPGTIPPLIPRELLFGYSDYEYASMSPDGQWLAYLAPYNGIKNVFIASISHMNNQNPARFGPSQVQGIPMSNELSKPVLFFQWTYQNGTLIYIQDNEGEKNFALTKVNAHTRESSIFVEVRGVQATIIATSPEKPNQLILGVNDRDPRYFDLYLVDITSGQRQLIFRNERFSELYFDQQLELRLAKQQTDDGSDEYYSPQGAIGSFVWNIYRSVVRDDALMTKPLRFDVTGKLLFWVDNTNRDKAALIETIFERKIARVIYEPTNSDVSEVNFDPQTGRPVFVRVNQERHEILPVDVAYNNDVHILKSIPGDVTIEDMSNDMTTWLISYELDTKPKSYYLYERASGRLQPLLSTRQQLRRYPLSRMHPIQVPTRDNYLQLCYLSLPLESDPNGRGRPNTPLPLVMWIHGGPTARDSWGFSDWAQFYTNRGYAVLQCNFRGSVGLGKEWLNLGNGEWAGRMHDDIVDAVNWAVGRGIAIKDAVAIGGGSYGGYETLVALTFTPDIFSCGIDVAGPTNLVTLLKSVPSYWKPMLNQLMYRIGGNPEDPKGLEYLKSRSPLYFADQIIRPILVAHGGSDPRVSRSEADQIVEAVKSKHIPVTYLTFPDEGHGLIRQENRVALAAVVELFLQKCLGGRAQVFSELPGSSVRIIEGGNMTQLTALAAINNHYATNFIKQDLLRGR